MSSNKWDDLRIDRYNLERELIQQPQLFLDWALAAANASVIKEKRKDEIETTKAKVEELVRRHPSRYNIENPTEAAIRAAVIRHPKVKAAKKKYFRALKEEKSLLETKWAFEQRKKMLEKLVDLNLQLHFSEPKVPLTKKEQVKEYRRRERRRRLDI